MLIKLIGCAAIAFGLFAAWESGRDYQPKHEDHQDREIWMDHTHGGEDDG